MLQLETYYHIFNHGNGDDNLFREEKNYDFFLKKYHQHIDPIADTVAWCLMKNHFHLLVKIKSGEEVAPTFPKFETLEKLENQSNFISKRFANFFSSYTQAFNKVYKRRGSLFLKNFRRKEIPEDGYLRILIRYIHLNPIKHGFTNNLLEWEYSSYDTFTSNQSKLTTILFGDEANYRFVHQQSLHNFSEYERLENELT